MPLNLCPSVLPMIRLTKVLLKYLAHMHCCRFSQQYKLYICCTLLAETILYNRHLQVRVQVRELAVKAACVIAGCDFGALLQPHRVIELES